MHVNTIRPDPLSKIARSHQRGIRVDHQGDARAHGERAGEKDILHSCGTQDDSLARITVVDGVLNALSIQ